LIGFQEAKVVGDEWREAWGARVKAETLMKKLVFVNTAGAVDM